MHQDFETKYTAPNSKAGAIKAWLEANFPADPEFPEAVISSIYFDTQNLKHLDEKLASDHIKSKFRIRWYEDPITRAKSEVSFQEFKHKIGENRHKVRLKLPNHFAQLPLESSEFNSIMNQMRVFEGKVLEHLHPSFIVSYTRKRFVLPSGLRLCIDYNINVPKLNLRLIKRPIKRKYLSTCVFELKGHSAVMPPELYPLERMGLYKDSFSKYEQCYSELIQN